MIGKNNITTSVKTVLRTYFTQEGNLKQADQLYKGSALYYRLFNSQDELRYDLQQAILLANNILAFKINSDFTTLLVAIQEKDVSFTNIQELKNC